MFVLCRTHRGRFPDGAGVRALRDRRYRTKVGGFTRFLTLISREQGLSGVLQAHTVFVSVSKGQVGKKEGLVLASGTHHQTAVDFIKRRAVGIRQRVTQLEQMLRQTCES